MIEITTARLIEEIARRAGAQSRVIVGLAGGPGSGKSTVAELLAEALSVSAAVVPMDGFHMDNADLIARDLLDRKGAPETFDAASFVDLIRQLHTEADVAYPTFDRVADKTVPKGGMVAASTRVVLVEGNYLLLDQAPWSELADLFDLTVTLAVPRDVLEARLVARWLAHGLSREQAQARALGNDLPNVDFVRDHARQADFMLRNEGQAA
ncbi:MAG: phosphoribulokinase [Sulfitobacter sp.]